MIQNKSRVTYFFLLILASIFIFQLFRPCYTSDFSYHLNRLYALTEALRNSSFPNYMNYFLIDGYGYLVNFFYSDLLFLPFAIISLCTDIFIGYQCLIFSTTILCALFSYIAYNKIFKNEFGAFIFAILYTTASYRIFDLYFRGAMGETIGICFLPLILWGIYEIIYGNSKKWYILSIGYSLLIYTHTISSFIVFCLIVLAIILSINRFIKEKTRIIHLIFSGLLCFILNLYFIVPFLSMILSDSYHFETNTAFPFVVTYTANHVLEGLFTMYRGHQTGDFPKVGMLIFFPAFFLRAFLSRNNRTMKILDIFLLISLFLIFCNTLLFPWKSFPFSKLLFIQMGSRFIPMATLLLTICTSYYLTQLISKKIIRMQIVVFITFISLFAVYGEAFTYNVQICKNEPQEITLKDGFPGIMFAEFLPEKFPEEPSSFTKNRGKYTISYSGDSTAINNITKKYGVMTFDVSLVEPDTLILPLTYYKGYEVKLNDTIIDYQKSEDGLIQITTLHSGRVDTAFHGSIWITISFYISILSYLIVFILISYKQR